MLVSVRDSLSSDWPRLWPLLQAMGTAEDEETGLVSCAGSSLEKS